MEIIYSRVKRNKENLGEVFSSGQHRGTRPETIDHRPPEKITDLRDGIPKEIAQMIMRMLAPFPATRPKMPEVVSIIDLSKAQHDEKILQAQREMVTTKTRPIPSMDSLADPKLKKLMKLMKK